VIPDPALVWLIGPSGSGKSHWAEAHFRPSEIVSSDELRGIVGSGPNDMNASKPDFEVLESIATARLEAGLLTVVDTLGFDDAMRGRLEALATAEDIPLHAVLFPTPRPPCRERNQQRDRPVPARAHNAQFTRYADVVEKIASSAWTVQTVADEVHVRSEVAVADPERPSEASPRSLEFHLQISTFDWMEKPVDLSAVARAAEAAGFVGVSVMDHLVQIPQVGRAWDAMLDPYIALSSISAVTDRLRLGVLVTNVTLRPVAVLAKMMATLDVVSGGRVDCGLGAGWFAKEQVDRGIAFPPAPQRLDILEDTVGALRRFWGAGGKAWSGKTIEVTDSSLYPRPIQDPIPIIIGGGGEKRTLKLVAELADGCNLQNGTELEHKLEVLRGHCQDAGRSLDDLLVTVLDVTLVGTDREHTANLVEQYRGRTSARQFRARTGAGTIDEQTARYQVLADLGIDRVYVSLMNLSGPGQVERFAPVLGSFQ
jgi:alkanesulfonate monooxygenase SsuD/methylene tetrahydromethanopterin reductase-like flavin-dependent oxidoreductase (luciferase family)/predicted kinase